MNSQKFVIGGIAGGIVSFLLGWVVYGMLLKDFMAANYSSLMRPDSETIWWSLSVGQLAFGFLLAYVIGKANAASAGSGAAVGFVVGLISCLGIDFTMYGVSTMLISVKGIIADVAATAVISAIAGAVVGAVMGAGKKSVAMA